MLRTMIRPFQILDSMLLAAAVFAISVSILLLMRDAAAIPWIYITVFSSIMFAVLASIGTQRGRQNLDGVIIGPFIRISAIFVLLGAGSFWLWLWLGRAAMEDRSSPDNKELSADCRQRLDRVEAMYSALNQIVDRVRAGSVDAAEFRAKFNMLEGSDRHLHTCQGSEVTDHVNRRDALIKNLREYYNKPTEQPVANLIDVITKNHDKTGNRAKPTYVVETEKPRETSTPSKVYLVVENQDQPQTDNSATKDGGSSGTANPSQSRRRVEYRSEYRAPLLAVLLGGFGIQWGSTSVTVDEVETAVEQEKKQNSGKPLDDLFDRKNLTQTQRSEFVRKLLELGLLEEATGSEWGSGIKTYISKRKETELCLAISREVGLPGLVLDLNTIMQWRKKEVLPQNRNKFDAEVRGCLESLPTGRIKPAFDLFQELVDKSEGS